VDSKLMECHITKMDYWLILIHLSISLILLVIRKVWTDGKITIDVTFKSLIGVVYETFLLG
jgi:hypothetical protein